MKQKVWDITVKDNPNRVVMGENDKFYTTDTEAYLVFKLDDENFNPATAVLTLENRNDGSLKNETVDVIDGLIEWGMPERYIEHFGNWQGQLVYEDTKDGQPELYTSAAFSFVVNAHIGDKKKPGLVEIENWEKFIREGTELIETWEDMEDLRQANEAQRQANYQELLDTGVLQTNINEKLEDLEGQYAPKLTEVTAQLAQKVGSGKLATLNDFDEETLNFIHDGTGGTVSVESIPKEKSVTPDKTTFMRTEKVLLVENVDAYIDRTGNVVPQSGFSYSGTFELHKGETIVFEAVGYKDNLAMISRWADDSATRGEPLVISDGEERMTYTYTAKWDVEPIRLSWRTGYGYSLYKYTDFFDSLELYKSDMNDFTESIEPFIAPIEEFMNPTFDLTASYYITSAPKIVPHPKSEYVYSDVIKLFEGDKVTIEGVRKTANVSIVTKTDSEGNLLAPLVVSNSNDTETFEYTATDEAEYVRLSYHTGNNPTVIITRNMDGLIEGWLGGSNNDSDEPIEDEEQINHDYKHLVVNAIAVGDSLTDGGYYADGHNGRAIKENYPYYLRNITDWNVTEAGTNGRTASSWWKRDADSYDFADYDTTIIWLGTNDGLTETVDEDTTISEGQTYLDYADTHTGNYCKIIEKALDENPRMHIHLVKVQRSEGPGAAATNRTIEQIAEKYELPVVDLEHLKYGVAPDTELLHPADNKTHFGKIGNIRIARDIYESIIRHINDNLEEYEQVLIE